MSGAQTDAQYIEARTMPLPETGCWIWMGRLDKDGYGEADHRRRGTKGAHRLAYRTFKGSIPDGLYVLHRCDVPSCVNPNHLFVGTAKDNAQDCIHKNRFVRGGKNGMAKLVAEDVAYIRRRLDQFPSRREVRRCTGAHAVVTELASRFGVTPENIYSIKYGRSWK